MLSSGVELLVQCHKLTYTDKGVEPSTAFVCCVTCVEEIKIKLVQIRGRNTVKYSFVTSNI